MRCELRSESTVYFKSGLGLTFKTPQTLFCSSRESLISHTCCLRELRCACLSGSPLALLKTVFQAWRSQFSSALWLNRASPGWVGEKVKGQGESHVYSEATFSANGNPAWQFREVNGIIFFPGNQNTISVKNGKGSCDMIARLFCGLGVGTTGQAWVILKATDCTNPANIYHASGSKEILEIRGQETETSCFLCVKCDTKGVQGPLHFLIEKILGLNQRISHGNL